MGFFRKIWNRLRRHQEEEYEFEEWNEIVYDRDDLQIHDREQRQEYLRSCLDQIAEASSELENLQFEYGVVTSQLKDMEEIDALPEEEHLELEEAAHRIGRLEEQRAGYLKRTNRMSEDEYRKMEAMEEEIQEGYEKLKKAEEYQELVRADMKRLGNEKEAYQFRKYELQRQLEDLKGMIVVCLAAAVLCVILLLVLQFGFQMNARVGYLLTAGAAALGITLIFIRHNDAFRELKRVEKSINKLILLHNTVKIRYVNNTNLLEYQHLKYGVASARELDGLWKQYQAEKTERDKFRAAEQELDQSQRELLRILRRYQIKDPTLWLHQTAAILDKKEMVEIRHNLIIRRQSLRRRMDYNKDVVAGKAQAEIRDLAEKYPAYAGEILQTVGEYEKKFR